MSIPCLSGYRSRIIAAAAAVLVGVVSLLGASPRATAQYYPYYAPYCNPYYYPYACPGFGNPYANAYPAYGFAPVGLGFGFGFRDRFFHRGFVHRGFFHRGGFSHGGFHHR